jgi:hypothetical protein
MLRLAAKHNISSNVIRFDDVEEMHAQRRALLAEAKAIEAWRGKNPYGDFLRKFGRRPDRNEAAAIGLLMDARVKASDGSMQPPLSKPSRARKAVAKKERIRERNESGQAFRLRKAILVLAANRHVDSLPALKSIGLELGEEKMKEHLDQALLCLNRLTQEFLYREEGKLKRNT